MKITILFIIISFCLTNDNELYQYYHKKFSEINYEIPEVVIQGLRCTKGDCENGEGRFELITPMFEGEYKNSEMHGKGVQVWQNGDFVNGLWENGEMFFGVYCYGYGDYYGDTYVGEFKNGYKEGEGTYKRYNGDIYNGEWKNDLPNGKGTELLSNGIVNEGKFINGEFVEKTDL